MIDDSVEGLVDTAGTTKPWSLATRPGPGPKPATRVRFRPKFGQGNWGPFEQERVIMTGGAPPDGAVSASHSPRFPRYKTTRAALMSNCIYSCRAGPPQRTAARE
ncbi:hypothetical protein AAFF_G00228730 [Aldrovandia affinis]|uniref:Uncharacterized protein n=1 Tax=Aldrovandia affinis TaxID=143900 RepID=A0AAD7SVB2_9TELE|nr:hypothetical protein AAFF_G00228730 [Aldrovandia affinis]